MMLRQIGEMQKEAMSTMGPQNPLTDIQKLSNTLREMTALAGFKDTSQFWSDPAQFQPPPPEPEKPTVERAARAGSDPVRSKRTCRKRPQSLQMQRQKMVMEDDRKRDELEADLYVKAEEMKAKYGTQLNVAQIKADMAINREVMKAQAEIITDATRED